MDFLVHMAIHAVKGVTTGIYHGIRKAGYSVDAKEYFMKRGYSENVASSKGDSFAEEMEKSKQANASKEQLKQICMKHGLPVSLFIK